MELYEGRPLNTDGRKEKEIKVYDVLDAAGIPYVRVDHPPVATIEACMGVDEALGIEICKNLFLCNRQKTAFYLLVMPGKKSLQTKELSKQIPTSRLSFASEEFMVEYLDIHPGAVSVMGLMNDTDNHVRLLIDEDVLKGEYIGCHPCVNTSSLKIRTKDIVETFLPAVHHDMTVVKLTGE